MRTRLSVQRVTLMQVIEVETREGTGEPGDPIRPVYSYWKPGEPNEGPLAYYDPFKHDLPAPGSGPAR